MSQLLIRLGDDNNKDRDRYLEALRYVNLAKQNSLNADVYFHSGIVRYKLEEYRLARNDFRDCLKANRERFEAERFSKLADSMIKEARKISRLNAFGGAGIAIFCGLLLVVLWGIYFSGWRRPVLSPTDRAASATTAKVVDAAKTTVATEGTAVKPGGEQTVEEKRAATTSSTQQALVVDQSMLTVMTPLLLGLLVVGLVLPNLTKLKLFGGFEAEISEADVKTKDISSGPKGEISFGSSLPTLSPGPR